MTVAALYVQPRGVYGRLLGVEPWGLPDRDARDYGGPWPVVAHPPCGPWGRYAKRRPDSPRPGPMLGDDGGCFAAALASVRTWGGVLEHPACTAAWWRYGLPVPTVGAWWSGELMPWPAGRGYVCHVEQGHYGHRARKATWLYYVGNAAPPNLERGPSQASILPREGRDPERERRTGAVQRMCRAERERTPEPFARLLVMLAASARMSAAFLAAL